MAGYSETPILKKLGIKESSKIFLVNMPADYSIIMGVNLEKQLVKKMPAADFYHIFAQDKKGLEESFLQIIAEAKADAVIWVSWYKKSSKIATDVTEDIIREIVLPTGWVDVKVCAVNDIWSGLKIVKRLKNR